jgi:O-succinylbenzoic acid--CoA ligase
MASQVATTQPGADAAEIRTSGRVLPHRELAISDAGEILVRGRTLFAGYVDGEAVSRPVDSNGWFHTGDRGGLDDEGRLIVRGRLDNVFISGGENVQPEEIERALLALPDVHEAIVVPVPNEEFGRRPVAFVRLREGVPSPEAIRSALRLDLPGYMIPVAVYPMPENESSGLKPARRDLERLAAERI